MISIIFGPPGTGKTCFLTHMLHEAAFNRERNHNMQLEILNKIQNGFKNIKTIPIHCVSANYDCCFKKFRYSPRFNRKINPYRLGFSNKFVKTHFTLPYECIGITEAQKYLNSRMSLYYPSWQSRWYEQHRHDDLDIYLDTQRPMLIDANIRDIASFIEIVKLSIHHDKKGEIVGSTWKVRKIANSRLFDRYMASGEKDTDCYVEEEITANYNVFKCYDSKSCKPNFYAGHETEDFDYKSAEIVEDNYESYLRYLKENDDELPDEFYQRRKT